MSKVDNQQGPTLQLREPCWVFCTNYMRKESKKERIYVYVQLNHFDV